MGLAFMVYLFTLRHRLYAMPLILQMLLSNVLLKGRVDSDYI